MPWARGPLQVLLIAVKRPADETRGAAHAAETVGGVVKRLRLGKRNRGGSAPVKLLGGIGLLGHVHNLSTGL